MNEDKVREKFEAWAVQTKDDNGLPYFVFAKTPDGLYADDCANHAFDGYRAAYAQARSEALEEAAKRCTNTMLMNVESYCGATAHTCADAIRALIKD